MPIVPGDCRRTEPPGKCWKYFDKGVYSVSEVSHVYLDDLSDDDAIIGVNSLAENHRQIFLTYLRSISIDELGPGFFCPGTGITPEFNREWQLYKQKKARLILSHFGREAITGEN
jgi:hypothetical protein